MKNKNLKWMYRIILNSLLILVLLSLFTFIIGFFLKADEGTSRMVLEMGLILVFPTILLNIIFLISTIFVKKNWAKILLTYLPAIATLILILFTLNGAWTPIALFFSIFIANTIWLYRIKKANNN